MFEIENKHPAETNPRARLKTTTNGFKIFKCPGCNNYHSLRVEGIERPRWDWNGDNLKPTFKPSILATTDFSEKWGGRQICHSFVTNGRIEFLSDCTHELACQTVEIAPWPHKNDEFGGIID